MRAGFARRKITPPVGTRMMGFGGRDREKGCEGIHDDLYVHALCLNHQGLTVAILTYDLCFFSRSEADRIRGCIGRRLDLAPRQMLINTSHTRCGPVTGADWSYNGHQPADALYVDEILAASIRAAEAAHSSMREASVRAFTTTTRLPLSRRRPDGKGGVEWRPYQDGEICDVLPVCLLEDQAGNPICLLYSVSCHPSTTGGWLISADYPGVANDVLNKHLGLDRDGGAMFLQGCGGDAKARVVGDGRDGAGPLWRSGSWDEVAAAGREVAEGVIAALGRGTKPCAADLACAEIEMEWPLGDLPDRSGFEARIADVKSDDLVRLWARRQLQILERRGSLETTVSLLTQGVKIADGVRMIGIEGEAVAGLGRQICGLYPTGVTFPLGYVHGTRLYLPTEAMLAEHGYEVDSYYEYGFPAPLAAGFERILRDTIEGLKSQGID
jgi:hypothetical protein